MTFWIIAGIVVVAIGVLWLWADRHSAVRSNLRGHRIDEALKNEDAQAQLFRNDNGNQFGAGF